MQKNAMQKNAMDYGPRGIRPIEYGPCQIRHYS